MPDSCQYNSGISKAEKKVNYVKNIMADIGLEPERLDIFSIGAGKASRFIDVANMMVERVKGLKK
jgi:coenzyme F420-reducing hydrogenase delta subunit